VWDGAGGSFDEGLTKEFGASPTPVDPMGLATALGNWRDAREHLKSCGGCEAVALLTKSSEKPRCEDLSSAGKVGEQVKVWQCFATTCNFFVESEDAGGKSAELREQRFDEKHRRLDCGVEADGRPQTAARR
jgi:hypothetical protein